MNLCIFEGHLTRDPQLRVVSGSDNAEVSVLNFSIGINSQRNKSVFPNLEAWDKKAETIAKWFQKGDLIRVYCELVTETWEDKTTGQKRSRAKYRVRNFEFPPLNKGRNKDETTEEAEETLPPREEVEATLPPRPKVTRKTRQTVPVNDEDDNDSIPF